MFAPRSSDVPRDSFPGEKLLVRKCSRLSRCRTSISSARASHGRQKMFSQSDDRIFEHPEVTIKPLSGDEKSSRRSTISARMFDTNENNGGSVPNMLEHPDMKAPLVMQTQQVSSSLESSSNGGMNDSQKFLRQQSGKNEPMDCARIRMHFASSPRSEERGFNRSNRIPR